MRDPGHDLPATVGLTWDEPIRPTELHLIFDTGLHRVLTLSHSNAYTSKMMWGRPQPETVRDYQVDAQINNRWQSLFQVKSNYQRLRKHSFVTEEPISTLRVTISATNGLDHARICEIRVY